MSTTNSMLARVFVPTAASAIITTALAVAVNFATGQDAPWWQWLIVAALTFAQYLVWLWLYKRQNSPHEASAAAMGDRSAAVAGNVHGNITTGSTGTAAAAPPPAGGPHPPATTQQGSAIASGTRSAAVAGNVYGHITTGDSGDPGPAAPQSSLSSPPRVPAAAPGSAIATGSRSAAVSGDVTGNISTGDNHP
ncbi:hypothetical protein [Nocardia salmonicida]|uniref:hypothetical protein n=1 Tax=Nocardia salmonicida TaxID=53431 RepID=UPI00340D7600